MIFFFWFFVCAVWVESEEDLQLGLETPRWCKDRRGGTLRPRFGTVWDTEAQEAQPRLPVPGLEWPLSSFGLWAGPGASCAHPSCQEFTCGKPQGKRQR